MQIHFRRARAQLTLERPVLGAHRFPVERDFANDVGVETGVAPVVLEGGNQRSQRRLRGCAAERVHRRIDGIDPGIDRRHDGGRRRTRGIVGVKVDGMSVKVGIRRVKVGVRGV